MPLRLHVRVEKADIAIGTLGTGWITTTLGQGSINTKPRNLRRAALGEYLSVPAKLDITTVFGTINERKTLSATHTAH